MDPVAVLSASEFHWLVRLASHNVVVSDQKAAMSKSGGAGAT